MRRLSGTPQSARCLLTLAVRRHELADAAQSVTPNLPPMPERDLRRPEWPREEGQDTAAWAERRATRGVLDSLVRRLDVAPSWRGHVALFWAAGVGAEGLARIVSSRPRLFQIGPANLEQKFAFLHAALCLREGELARMIVRFPRLLEYSPSGTLLPRLDFFATLGLAGRAAGRVVMRQPSLLELSVQGTLEPRVAWLKATLGCTDAQLCRMLARSPALLAGSEPTLAGKLAFLRGALGGDEARAAAAARGWPSLLLYSTDSMRRKLDFLSGVVGMTEEERVLFVRRFPNIFTLSIEENLLPKWRYLVSELGGDRDSLLRCAPYFSISLANRIVPRHHFLLLKGRWVSPLPLGLMLKTDAAFARGIGGTTLDQYVRFKQALAESGALAGIVRRFGAPVKGLPLPEAFLYPDVEDAPFDPDYDEQ